jgi:transposase
MENIGLDLHTRESQLAILTADGELLEVRIRTTRERFTEVLGNRPRARILLEASTESEWVARHLEEIGHEVVVADPNFAPMYATRSRRVKTDKRDARTLYDAARQGTYRPAHRLSAARRHVRAELAVRQTLVRTRTRMIALAKALVRRDGLRVARSQSRLVMRRLQALDLPVGLRTELAPLFAVMAPLTAQIEAAEARLAALVAQDPAMQRLETMPMIGPVTACAVVAVAFGASRARTSSKPIWGSCPASRARGRSGASGPLPRRATRTSGGC